MFANMKNTFKLQRISQQLIIKKREILNIQWIKKKIPTRQNMKDRPIETLSPGVFIVCTAVSYLNPGFFNTSSYTSGWFETESVKTQTDINSKKVEKGNSLNTNNLAIGNEKPATGEVEPEENHFRIILLGATGSGKSSVGNTLLGKDAFKTSYYATTETKISELKSKTEYSCKIDIIDTPAVLDTENKKEVKKAADLSSPGPHAFLLCIPATSMRKYYTESYEPFREYFDDQIEDFVIVAFTRFDQFEKKSNKQKSPKEEFESELSSAIEKNSFPKDLKNISKNHILFSNKTNTKDSDELTKIISKIREREKDNKICRRKNNSDQ